MMTAQRDKHQKNAKIHLCCLCLLQFCTSALGQLTITPDWWVTTCPLSTDPSIVWRVKTHLYTAPLNWHYMTIGNCDFVDFSTVLMLPYQVCSSNYNKTIKTIIIPDRKFFYVIIFIRIIRVVKIFNIIIVVIIIIIIIIINFIFYIVSFSFIATLLTIASMLKIIITGINDAHD